MNESAGSVVVCYDVLSGRTASRSISMQLRTFPKEAKGELGSPTYIDSRLHFHYSVQQAKIRFSALNMCTSMM